MEEALDHRYLTTRKVGCQYLQVVISGFQVWAMYDTSAYFTTITGKLAQQLGNRVLPHRGMFTLANGVFEQYAGRLGREVL